MQDITRKGPPPPEFSLVDGGLSFQANSNTVQLFVQDHLSRVRALDAMVIEEDTYLVLSTPHRQMQESAHPVRVIHRAYNAEPEMPGAVIVKAGSPLLLLAVVHHLSYDPSFSEEWITLALENVMCFCAARQIRSLGTPILGSVYGSFPAQRFLSLLRGAMERRSLPGLREIWLQAYPHESRHILSLVNLEFGYGKNQNRHQ
ncbi:MAG: hypothetical protein JXQ27_16615 [Acidobacteria bacterium]|nr:hypothetical protein [Acidobacteriota bacterium]